MKAILTLIFILLAFSVPASGQRTPAACYWVRNYRCRPVTGPGIGGMGAWGRWTCTFLGYIKMCR